GSSPRIGRASSRPSSPPRGRDGGWAWASPSPGAWCRAWAGPWRSTARPATGPASRCGCPGRRRRAARPDRRGGAQVGFLRATRQPRVNEHGGADPRFARAPVMDVAGARSCLAVVVHGDSQDLAIVIALDPTPRRFTTEDVDFLQSIANVLAAAMLRARDV